MTGTPQPYRTRESGFFVAGIEVRTSNALESDPRTARLPEVWERLNGGELIGRVPRRLAKERPFGVYYNYEGDENGAYSVVAGFQVPGLGDVDEGLTGLNIPAGRYLLFVAEGPMPQTLRKTWGQIWAYFKQPGAPKRAFTFDYEVYENPIKVSVFISIR